MRDTVRCQKDVPAWGVAMSISRRDFINLVGTSVAGASAIAVSARMLSGNVAADSPTTVSPTTVSPTTGSPASVGNWSVAEVGAVDRGAIPFIIENRDSGERIRIEGCRRGSRLQPVAQSRDLDLFLANNGDGSARTAREHELVARALARHIDANRSAMPASVVSLDTRHARHRELFTTADDPANA
jgi:hypothetical protein